MKSIAQIVYELVHTDEPTKEEEKSMKDELEALIANIYGSGILYSEAVREFKKKFILHVLKQNKGNQCKAARELGMHRNTLSRTIADLKLDIRQLKNGRGYQAPPGRKPTQPAAMAAAAGAKQA